MPSLVEGLSRFVGRVEILALGLDDKRLVMGDALCAWWGWPRAAPG